MSAVWAYVPDLMDRSRMTAAGVTGLHFVTRPDELSDAPVGATVVVDLSRDGVLTVLGDLDGRRRIGFGSHVDRERLEAARRAGCDLVLARSEFFRRLSDVIQ
jgi:hypothetical protein